MVTENLQPEKVFYFMEEISKIPHGSGNIDQISEYLVEFAKKRNLRFIQDEMKNVIIFKEASKGYEEKEPVMLQGHMDMVAVKKPGCEKDMKTEGLDLMIEGDWLYAKDTSLGGDDGIAVAYELALLEDDSIHHPRLECIFTVDEEIGLLGAKAIDLSECKARRMINLDSEEEGIFLVGCAGGMRADCTLPLSRERAHGTVVELTVGGLLGGHSGVEIHKERGNSNTLMGRVLTAASRRTGIRLITLEGGLADNAIPRETRVSVFAEEPEVLLSIVKDQEAQIKRELQTKDPDVFCRALVKEEKEEMAVSMEDTKKVALLLHLAPAGVQAMSKEVEGLVETSLNMGLASLKEDGLHAGFSIRSSIDSAKYMIEEKLTALTEALGGSVSSSGDYPGWAYRADSPLRELMIRIYREMYEKEPVVEAIHAGLECGFFLGKLPDLDCVSMGPEMKDIHTTEERMSISSVQRVWEYLLRVLEEA